MHRRERRGGKKTITMFLCVLSALCAETAAAHALLAKADPAGAFYNRGVELQEAGDLQGARQAYEKALEVAPQRVEALSNLGLVHLQLGANEKAIEYLGRALKISPGLTALRAFLGLAYFRMGQFEPAHREVAKALKDQPENPQAPHLNGLCLFKLDRLQEGIAALAAALKANPKNLEAAYTLATAYVANGQPDQAEALLEGPLRSVSSAEIYLVRGRIQGAKGNFRQAAQDLTEAKRLNSELPTLRTQLGLTFTRLGDYPRAMDEFRAALVSNPSDFEANAFLGWLYVQDRRYQEAAEFVKEALRQRPGDGAFLYKLMGQIHHAAGNHPEAASLLERAVQERSDYIPAHILLARVYAKLKRLDDFARQQTIIRRLTEQEQERNLRARQGYGDRAPSLAGLEEKPAASAAGTKGNR